VVVNFVENDGGYHSAYKYVCKNDNAVFHSEGHPNLAQVGSPATKRAMRGYHMRRSSNKTARTEEVPVPDEGQSCAPKRTCARLTWPEVCDFCIANNVKIGTELLSLALE